jgi:hypothetical protein
LVIESAPPLERSCDRTQVCCTCLSGGLCDRFAKTSTASRFYSTFPFGDLSKFARECETVDYSLQTRVTRCSENESSEVSDEYARKKKRRGISPPFE